MRDKAIAGLLFVAGLMLIVTGFPGTVGDLLAAILAPEALVLNTGNGATEDVAAPLRPSDGGAGTSGGF